MAKAKKEKKQTPIKKFFEEFKKFITRGNVLDMAVGVIVGGAFTAIVNGVSNYVLKPLINWMLALITKGEGLAGAVTFLSKAYLEDGSIDMANSLYLDWGALIITIINFFVTAFVLFLIVRMMNRVAENNKKLKAEMMDKKHKEIKKIRKAEKVSRKVAKAIYAQRLAEAVAAAEAEAKAKEAAEAAAAEEAARIAEEKAMAPTVLLGEIRALLERIAPPLPEENEEEEAETTETTEEETPVEENTEA